MDIFEEVEKQARVPRLRAYATVHNQIPSGWNAIVIEVGVNFRFQNAQGQVIPPDESVTEACNTPSGDSKTVSSRKDGCCQDMYVAAKVTLPDQQPVIVAGWAGTPAGPQECKLSCDMYLRPKRNVQRGAPVELELVPL
jgi:hypothetical protein